MQAIMPRSVAEARPWANEPANPAPHPRQADHEPQSPDAPRSPRLRSPSRPIPPPPTARGDRHPRGGFRRASASRPGGPHGPRTLRSALPQRQPSRHRRSHRRDRFPAWDHFHRRANDLPSGDRRARFRHRAGTQPPLRRPEPKPRGPRDNGEAHAAGDVLGIAVVDHVIVTHDPRRWYSMTTHGTLPRLPPSA